jgi:hypothetical protein
MGLWRRLGVLSAAIFIIVVLLRMIDSTSENLEHPPLIEKRLVVQS